MKKKKGFTLIELMIVLAIIGILAVVLVPKISTTKTSAKLAGIDTNMRSIQGDIQGMISNYTGSDAANFEADLFTKLQNSDYKNPITGTTGMAEWSNLQGANGAKAIGYYLGDNSNLESVNTTWGIQDGQTVPQNGANLRTTLTGMVLVCAYPDPNNANQLDVKLIPFDENGNAIQYKVVTIK